MARRPSLAACALALVALLASAGAHLAADGRGDAETALAAGRFGEARDLFVALLDEVRAPADRVPLLRGLAAALYGLGESEEALEPLDELAGIGTPEDRLAYAEALVAHVRSNLNVAGTASTLRLPYLADAIAAAERTAGEERLRERRLAVVGDAHDLAGRLEQAVATWQAAGLADPPTAEQRWIRARLAHALYRLGRHRDAAATYASVGDRRGEAASWAAAREAEKALALYAGLLADQPGDDTLVADALATARFAGGQERLDAILAALPAEGERAVSILRARARLAEQKNDFPRALAHLRAARAAAPALGPGLAADLARVLVRGGTGGEAAREEAAASLIEAWKDAAGDTGLRDLMLAIAAQDFADAWRAWPDRRPLDRSVALQRAALTAAEDDPVAWANLANTLRLAGDVPGAVAALEKAVVLAPDDAAAWNDLGLARSAAGRPSESVEAFGQAVAKDGSFLAGRQNLARALWRQGDDAGAMHHLAEAERAARSAGASWMLYRFLANRAWRTQHRPERR